MNLPDNGQVRKEILRTMVDEELLISEAVRRGYADDSEGKHEKERMKIQELLNGYYQNKVGNRIRVTDEDLRTLYARLNTKVKARHLYASSIRKADSLHAVLMRGESFEKLASEVFTDPRLRDTGGALGTFTADEMDPALEEAAFTMAVGLISKPIRTAQGYSILQVEDRIVKPLLTESEYARRRSGLKSFCLRRKQKEAAQAHADSLRHRLDISFNGPVVAELLQRIHRRSVDPAQEKDNRTIDPDPLGRKELVRSKLGVWTVETFNRHAEFTSENQQKWIRHTEQLEDFIAGLVIRARLLAEAKAMGLQKSGAFKAAVRRKTGDYLLKRMETAVSDETVIPEDTLRARFAASGDRYAAPPGIHLTEILLDDKAEADAIKRMLLKGASFEKLARERTVRAGNRETGGDIGEFTRAELGAYADRLFALRDGEWTGPVQIHTQFALYKCVGRTRKRPLDFAEARSLIAEGLRLRWMDKTKQTLLETIRGRVGVTAYPERLRSVRIDDPAATPEDSEAASQ
jgi:peptidyl-prolyl cis-trans isomerase C